MALKILTIAGTDPTGGAGIIRDIETFSAFKLGAAMAITSVNVQDDHTVTSVNPLDPTIVSGQIRAALGTGKIAAIKIGQIATPEIARIIVEDIRHYPTLPIILDPVLGASSGSPLAKKGLIEIITSMLLPLVSLVTPNLPELALLSDEPIADAEETINRQAQKLMHFGAKAVLAKGGHGQGNNAIDRLYTAHKTFSFSNPRLDTTMRGTGCTLSSAIAVGLVQGHTMNEAIRQAKDYVTQLMQGSLTC